jgi:hypothetical protein
MSVAWPSDERRGLYIEFLELELRVMKSAAEGVMDEGVLGELNDLMNGSLPRTKAFIESRLPRDPARVFSDEVRTVAWAEARSVPSGENEARVTGEWTRAEIASDINECFAEARRRARI